MHQISKIALISNIPAPYRVAVYNEIAEFDASIFFCARSESNRSWGQQKLEFKHHFLRERVTSKSDGFSFIHNNPDIWTRLNDLKPAVVITTGFGPTHLYAFVWAKLHAAKHICMTDGTVFSESSLSWLHRQVRKVVFGRSHAFIAASKQGLTLYRDYGVLQEKIFTSQLCANNEIFFNDYSFGDREFDVIFSGQFHERKLPFLFIDVCQRLVKVRASFRVLLIGDGPLRDEVLGRLSQSDIDYKYAGFIRQEDLPKYYGNSKILLFTTRMDPWGVVANEAMAAGTPVITTPYAGVAGELVIDGVTGAVCEPDPDVWAKAVSRLLDDQQYWRSCSVNARRQVEGYNYKAAAEGIEAACRFALGRR